MKTKAILNIFILIFFIIFNPFNALLLAETKKGGSSKTSQEKAKSSSKKNLKNTSQSSNKKNLNKSTKDRVSNKSSKGVSSKKTTAKQTKKTEILKTPHAKDLSLEINYTQSSVKKGENYLIHTVLPKENLFRIAKKYQVSIEEIKKANGLSNNHLKVGMQLKIPLPHPSHLSHSPSEKSIKEKVSPSKEELRDEPILLTYRVKKGDTLKKIAAKFGVSVSELKRLNHLKNNKLSPNQKIIIGKITQPASPSTPLNEAFTYHTVKEGETLYRISLAYNIPVEELKRINHLEGNLISVGQKLRIPLASSIPEKPFVLESPKKTLEAREENLKEKFEKNIIAKNKILTPSMLSKDEEVALRQKFIELSKNLADSRYKLGGNGNGYLDCSAFVKLVYEELGIKLPRSSPQQFQVGMPVERDDLIPGDLVFFKTRGDRISHVGIYLGDNRFIHISSSKKRISIDSLDDPYFKRRYAGAKRVLNGEVLEYFQDYLKKNSNNLKSQENTETSSIPEVIF